ncbi:MAG TPA: hypothetical protein VFA45_16155 [Actinomycetes bacterium]|jgi:hypothetical protein|nr:hypothetical protein [Actinomycetes bacterium]
MARRRTAAQLAASLDRVATKPAGDVAGDELEHDQDREQTAPEDQEQAGGRVDVDHTPAGPGRAHRVVVRVPAPLKQRLERHVRRTGATYTSTVLDAYAAHADELLGADTGEPAPPPAGPGGLPRLPQRDVGHGGRRRGINAVDLPLSLYDREREVLEAAWRAGAAHSLSDLVTRCLELALSAPPRRR